MVIGFDLYRTELLLYKYIHSLNKPYNPSGAGYPDDWFFYQLFQVVSLIGVHPSTVRESVVYNKCDDLSAVYHLIVNNYKVS